MDCHQSVMQAHGDLVRGIGSIIDPVAHIVEQPANLVHLGQPAIELLDKIERVEKNPWVIVGTKPGARLTDLQPFWQRVRARAGLKDVRIHDLRHTFASTAVAAGQGLPMIGKLLGHTQVQTTARYAHLAADPVKAAAEQVASNIAAFLNQAT